MSKTISRLTAVLVALIIAAALLLAGFAYANAQAPNAAQTGACEKEGAAACSESKSCCVEPESCCAGAEDVLKELGRV